MAEKAGDSGRRLMAIVSIDITEVTHLEQCISFMVKRIEPVSQACSSGMLAQFSVACICAA